MQKKKVALITEIISPYRIPFLNELSNCEKIDLKVFFMAKTEQRRNWSLDMKELKFPYEILSGFTIQKKHNSPIFFNLSIFSFLL